MGVERSFRLPELMNQCKLKMHKVGHRWFEITEHGCAIGYGIHEVFHITLPVIILSYGLLGFSVIVGLDIVVFKGGKDNA